MSKFKEISQNIMTINGDGTANKRLVYSDLGGNTDEPVYFALKGGNDWTGNLVDVSTAFYLETEITGYDQDSVLCESYAKFIETEPSITPEDKKTIRGIWLNIPSAPTSRTITFSYNGMTVFTVNQVVNVNVKDKILICKPTWTTDPAFVKIDNKIGFSTRRTIENAYQSMFVSYDGISDFTKILCGVRKEYNTYYGIWVGSQLQDIPLKDLGSFDKYKTYYVVETAVDTGKGNIRSDFEGVTSFGLIYIYVITSNGPKNVGYVKMSKNKGLYTEIG